MGEIAFFAKNCQKLTFACDLTFDPRGQRPYFSLVVLIEPDPSVYDLYRSVGPFRPQVFFNFFSFSAVAREGRRP